MFIIVGVFEYFLGNCYNFFFLRRKFFPMSDLDLLRLIGSLIIFSFKKSGLYPMGLNEGNGYNGALKLLLRLIISVFLVFRLYRSEYKSLNRFGLDVAGDVLGCFLSRIFYSMSSSISGSRFLMKLLGTPR